VRFNCEQSTTRTVIAVDFDIPWEWNVCGGACIMAAAFDRWNETPGYRGNNRIADFWVLNRDTRLTCCYAPIPTPTYIPLPHTRASRSLMWKLSAACIRIEVDEPF
jgi:hypothetical protein